MESEKALVVGELTIETDRNEKRLNKRKCDAQNIVKALRVLADCFDEQKEDAYITQIENNRFDCKHPDVPYHPNRVRKADEFLTFPSGLKDIAVDIQELEDKIESSNRRLRAELDCD